MFYSSATIGFAHGAISLFMAALHVLWTWARILLLSAGGYELSTSDSFFGEFTYRIVFYEAHICRWMGMLVPIWEWNLPTVSELSTRKQGFRLTRALGHDITREMAVLICRAHSVMIFPGSGPPSWSRRTTQLNTFLILREEEWSDFLFGSWNWFRELSVAHYSL